MQLQISTDYAIRILQYLHKHQDELPTAMTISQAIGITYPFFIKIANQLKRKGFLNAVQGRNGGYRIADETGNISIYDIFLAIEGDLQINRCLQPNHTCSQGEIEDCPVHHFFAGMQGNIIDNMKSKTIADFAS